MAWFRNRLIAPDPDFPTARLAAHATCRAGQVAGTAVPAAGLDVAHRIDPMPSLLHR